MQAGLLTFGAIFGIFTLTVYLLAVGRDVLIPFVIAVIIWYLINALTGIYGKLARIPQWVALTGSIVTILLAVALIVELFSGSIEAISREAPDYQANIRKLMEAAASIGGFDHVPTIGQVVDTLDVRAFIGKIAAAVASIAGDTGLVVIYVLFLLGEQRIFPLKLKALCPGEERREEVRGILNHIQDTTRSYLSVKTFLSVVTGLCSYLVLVAVGVDFAGFWAFLIFLLNFIPTFGSLLGILLPALHTLLQFADLPPFLIVVVAIGAIQIVVGNVIEPRMMAKSLNISPLVVIISLVFWGSIWGLTGMFLAVPLTVILMIVLSEFAPTRPIAILMSGDGDLWNTPER